MRPLQSKQQILAPTDIAFEKLGLTPDNIRLTNRTALREVMRYHVLDGEVDAASMGKESPIGQQALSVSPLGEIQGNDGDEATIIAGDLSSSNGMIHAIDSVLLPFPEEQLTGDLFRDTPEGSGNDHVGVAALSAGLAAAVILVAAAIAVHKRRQADAAKPPQVAPDDGGWAGAARGAAVHPA